MNMKISSLILTLLLFAAPSFIMRTTNAQPSYPPRPQIFISPASYTGTTLNSIFNYTVMIRGEDGNGVDAYWDVAGFDVTVSWNNTLINLVAYSEGNFLHQGGADTFGFYNLANVGDTYSIQAVFVKLTDATPSSGVDSLLELEFKVTFVSYPSATCSVALDNTDLASWPHPERSNPPWNGQITAVDLPYDPLHTLDWGHSRVNATYIALDLSHAPRELKKDAIAELEAARTLATKNPTIWEIYGAVYDTQMSLNPRYWMDDLHVNGLQVFYWERYAIVRLTAILTSKMESPGFISMIQAVIDKLLMADETLANTAIADAKALGSTNPTVTLEIRLAGQAFSKATQASCPSYALDQFETAWYYAEKALHFAK
jgi:hypothetical protein